MGSFLDDKNFQAMEVLTEEGHEESSEKMTKTLFVDLMKQFYDLGWMRGTGGAMGVRLDQKHLLVSPSALQKERLKETDIFEYNLENHQLEHRPKNPAVTVSSCAPLFTHVMMGTGSKCVIHSHSLCSNLITQLVKEYTFSISHQEYIKGIYDPFSGKNLTYEDTLVIPIIENKPSESLLLPGLEIAMLEYPRATSCLVRNHGIFVWGNSWQDAKVQMECIDYLLKLGVKMLEKGLPLVKEDVTNVIASESSYKLSFAPDDSL